MKKLFCIMTVLISLPLLGQSDTTFKYTSIGIHASMNASRVAGTFAGSGINKVGIYSGISFKSFTTGNRFGYEIDASFAQKGMLKPPNQKDGDYTKFLMELNYAQLESFLTMNINDITYGAGIGCGYLISSSETDENDQIITGNGDFQPIELFGSLSVEFPLGDRTSLGFRMAHSIVPIRKHENGATFRLNRGQYSQVLSFMLRYTILGKRTVVQ